MVEESHHIKVCALISVDNNHINIDIADRNKNDRENAIPSDNMWENILCTELLPVGYQL